MDEKEEKFLKGLISFQKRWKLTFWRKSSFCISFVFSNLVFILKKRTFKDSKESKEHHSRDYQNRNRLY
jgi:hypothetical protein